MLPLNWECMPGEWRACTWPSPGNLMGSCMPIPGLNIIPAPFCCSPMSWAPDSLFAPPMRRDIISPGWWDPGNQAFS